MITINLLPKKDIRQLKLVRLRGFILKRVIILSVFGLLVILALGALDFMLRRNLEALNTELEAKMSEAGASYSLDLQEKIDRFNQNLEQVAKLQENHVPLNPFLVELARITPAKASLTSLKIFRVEADGELTGKAERRDDLLEFQANLKESDFFGSIESPLSNLTSRENVDFRFKFKIKNK